MLSVEVNRSNETVILRCVGRIVAGREVETLEAVALGQNARRLFIDLETVASVDAAGLGALAEIFRWAKDRGIQFGVLAPTRRVRTLMKLMKLDAVIPIVSEAQVSLCARSEAARTRAYLAGR
jgi:anti-anti-sigma factor